MVRVVSSIREKSLLLKKNVEKNGMYPEIIPIPQNIGPTLVRKTMPHHIFFKIH